MQALVACNEAPCLFTSRLCPTSALKNSFNKTMCAIATSSPGLDKRCMLRSGHVIRCSFMCDAGNWKNKSWHIPASLETEAIPEEPAEEEQTVPEEPSEGEQTVATPEEPAEGEQTVATPEEPAEEEQQTVAIFQEPTITTAEESDLPTVRVKFVLEKECHYGERYNVVGNVPLFGNWDPEAGVPMDWSEGHSWSVEKDVPIGKRIEFKFVLTGKDGEIEWQPGANRYFETTDSSISPLVVSTPWVSEEEEIEEGKPEKSPVEEGTEAPTVLGDVSLAADSGLGLGTGNQVSNEEEISTKRDIPVDEGNGQLPVSVSSDDEDKPETASELSTPEAALVAAILDAAQTDEFQS